MSSTTNLLATPGLPIVGTVALTQGATVTVGAEWIASGEFELRASKSSATRVRLAFHRRHGRSLSVSAKAHGRRLAPRSRQGHADDADDGDQSQPRGRPVHARERRAGRRVDRSDPEGGRRQHRSVADGLGAVRVVVAASRRRAVRLRHRSFPAGWRRQGGDRRRAARPPCARSATSSPRRAPASRSSRAPPRRCAGARRRGASTCSASSTSPASSSWCAKGTCSFDPVSGALTAADKVSARRIRVSSRPLESDAGKLRKVLFESLLVTTAYQASRALGSTVSLTAEQTYLEQRGPQPASRSRRSLPAARRARPV